MFFQYLLSAPACSTLYKHFIREPSQTPYKVGILTPTQIWQQSRRNRNQQQGGQQASKDKLFQVPFESWRDLGQQIEPLDWKKSDSQTIKQPRNSKLVQQPGRDGAKKSDTSLLKPSRVCFQPKEKAAFTKQNYLDNLSQVSNAEFSLGS